MSAANALNVLYLGHSGLLLTSGAHAVAVDPFLTGNPSARMKPEEVRCGSICVTHGHEDHVGDTVAIAKANGATCYSSWEVCNWLGEQGVKSLEPGNPGGQIATPWGWVAFTQAFHSSSHGGRALGNPCGIVLHFRDAGRPDGRAGVTVWHLGDTGIFGDMKLLGEIYRPDIACVPIGDRFTMGPELATRAAEMIGARVAIPIHYNTWPPIEVDVSRFKPAGVTVRALKPGERWTFGG